ncbi:hypothetical protein B0H67DRAFT_523585 [Lasiosphaeris hirsuta]|uniref:Cdc24/Scd1 N-terminal domain-containing protein n=1 Tax=Lasiosphaeris hirsuta TaxID=260670 RepID=A0AA40DLH9_9PEZI|nr:hypothetical protein B0H67DRAFT_523585 [Lasiosphaeris hirsuta]
MDPLSVVASITGLLSAAGAVARVLGPYIAAARDSAPKIAVQVNSEVQSATIILSALQSLAQNMASVRAQRAAIVQIDHVVAVLTDGVLIFSELEAAVGSLSLGDFSITRLALRSRLQWARKETDFASLLARLEGFKSSIALILDIFQSDSAMRAEECRGELKQYVHQLLESSRDVARRVMSLEDAFDAKSSLSKRRSVAVSLKLGYAQDSKTQRFLNRPSEDDDGTCSSLAPSTLVSPTSPSSFGFEPDLEASRVYRRAQRESMDFSFRSSVAWSNGMSVFSGLTFGDVSVMAVIALPIYADEICNSHHYDFGGQQPPAPITYAPTAGSADHETNSAARSLLYECVEIELQLLQIRGFAHIFRSMKRRAHPFNRLGQVFSRGYPFLMLERDGDPDYPVDAPLFRTIGGYSKPLSSQHFSEAIRAFSTRLQLEPDETFTAADTIPARKTGFLKILDAIKKFLAIRFETNPIKPDDIEAEIERRRGYSERLPPTDSVVKEFLLQERLFFAQLEDLPIVERQMRMLNLLVEDKISAIFTPLRAFMDYQLRFLLEIELNLLRSPQDQRWSLTYRKLTKDTVLYGKLIGTEVRTKAILRVRLGAGEGQKYRPGPQVDTIAACFRLVSLPALSMLGHLEFLKDMECHAMDDAVRRDITESKGILQQAYSEISRIVKQEDLSDVVSHLKSRILDWKHYNINQFGDLILHDDTVEVMHMDDMVRDLPRNKTTTPVRYRVYMFEKLVVFVEEISSQKPLRGQLETTKQLKLKGQIFLSKIRAVVPSSEREGTSCLIVHTVNRGKDLKALDASFMSRPQMHRWTEELRAAIQTPQSKPGQHQSHEPSEVGKLPIAYPKTWKGVLINRGFLSSTE